MLTLRGGPALSDHQTQKLFERVRAVAPAVRGVYAEYVHFVALSGDLDDRESALLDRLLEYGPSVPRRKLDGTALFVVPRLGTRVLVDRDADADEAVRELRARVKDELPKAQAARQIAGLLRGWAGV